MSRPLDVRLVPAALAGWGSAAVLVGASVRVAAGVALLAGAVALGLIGLIRWTDRGAPGTAAPPRRHQAASGAGLAAVTVAVVAAVAASAAAATARSSSALADEAAAAGTTVWLTAVVTSDPRPLPAPWDDGPPARSAVTLRVERLATGPEGAARAVQEVALPVSVIGGGAWADVRLGASLSTSGVLRPADGARPERFEVRRPGPPVVLAREAAPLRAAHAVRAGLARTVKGQDDDVAGLVRGMTVGDRAALPPELVDAMRATGLTHLTAVSGAHVAIVAGAALALLLALRVPRAARVGGVALVLVAFVVLVRPDPAVLRAAVMGGVALLGLAAGRPARAVPALAGAVVVLVVVDPWVARSFGFVLSAVATGALVLGAAPLAAALERRRVPSWLALLVAVPVVAQLACGPVVVLLSPTLPTYAVLANLLVAPVVAVATVSGVVAALLSPVWAAAAQWSVVPACWSAGWIARVATTLAGLPGASVPWPEGVPGALLLTAATLAGWGVALSGPAVRWWWWEARVRRRRARGIAALRRGSHAGPPRERRAAREKP